MNFNTEKEKIIFYYMPIILFSLIPFFLITGPFLSDLSVSLISILYLIYCYRKKNFSYFKNKYFYFFLIFWGYLIINSLINYVSFDNLMTSIVYCRFGIFVVAIVFLLNCNDEFTQYFFYCIFICFIFLILDGYYQYFTGENILGWPTEKLRISSFFGEERILGSYISRLWPIFFGLSIFIFKQKNKLFFLLILTFILSEALIFLSGDRTAFFNINLSAIFVILFSQKLFKLRFFILLASILLLFIISLINPAAKFRVFDQTINDMNIGSNQNEVKEVYIFSKPHTHLYITAYRMFLDNKILGVGLKNFRNFCNDERYKESELSCSTHPHNTYIQLLSETGIIGFIFLIIILIYYCKNLLHHLLLRFKGDYYFNDFKICVLSAVTIYLWPFIPTGSIFTNWLTIIMIINLPFLFWDKKLRDF